MARLWGRDPQHHLHRRYGRRQTHALSGLTYWQSVKAAVKAWPRSQIFWRWVLGVLGLFGVWGGLLLVASLQSWPGGSLIIVGVVCSTAWMFLYISEIDKHDHGQGP